MLTRIVRSGWICWFYVFKMLAPIGLTPIYPRWTIDPTRAGSGYPCLH